MSTANGPLRKAAHKGNLKEVTRQIEEKGANINAREKDTKETAFFKAANAGELEVLKYLARKGADICIKDCCGQNALHAAASRGHEKVVEFLLEFYEIDPSKTKVDELDESGGTALHLAAFGSHVAVVKLLLANGADASIKDEDGCDAITQAVEGESKEVVKLLGGDPSRVVEEPSDDDDDDWEDDTDPPLYAAAEKGDEEEVERLIQSKAEVNQVHPDHGETACHTAASNGHTAIVKLLQRHGADFTIKDCCGQTPFLGAVDANQEETALLMLNNGWGSVDETDDTGSTALHLAAYNAKREDLVIALLEKGAKVNAKDKEGMDVIDQAVEGGSKDFVQLLGGDPSRVVEELSGEDEETSEDEKEYPEDAV